MRIAIERFFLNAVTRELFSKLALFVHCVIRRLASSKWRSLLSRAARTDPYASSLLQRLSAIVRSPPLSKYSRIEIDLHVYSVITSRFPVTSRLLVYSDFVRLFVNTLVAGLLFICFDSIDKKISGASLAHAVRLLREHSWHEVSHRTAFINNASSSASVLRNPSTSISVRELVISKEHSCLGILATHLPHEPRFDVNARQMRH
ncbi:unnamed protein product [Leptosia nina]|uniref:Uncharacterized protein n=1 Tax=Leptosia nina TaxID=320188 RepID=A0AAV1IVD0_9NEOP